MAIFQALYAWSYPFGLELSFLLVLIREYCYILFRKKLSRLPSQLVISS